MTEPFAAPHRSGSASAWIHGEPTVDDLLDDPVVITLLQRDGLTGDDVRAAVALGRQRLNPDLTDSITKQRRAA